MCPSPQVPNLSHPSGPLTFPTPQVPSPFPSLRSPQLSHPSGPLTFPTPQVPHLSHPLRSPQLSHPSGPLTFPTPQVPSPFPPLRSPNLFPSPQVKCTQYWPSSGSQVYSNVTVTHVDTSNFADFDVRRFKIQSVNDMCLIYFIDQFFNVHMQSTSKESRAVTQFHFVSWPDFGVPRNPTSLLHFLQRVRHHQPYGQTQPIVVHCRYVQQQLETACIAGRLS